MEGGKAYIRTILGIKASNVTKRHLRIIVLRAWPALRANDKLNVICWVTLRFGRHDERVGQLGVPGKGVAGASIDEAGTCRWWLPRRHRASIFRDGSPSDAQSRVSWNHARTHLLANGRCSCPACSLDRLRERHGTRYYRPRWFRRASNPKGSWGHFRRSLHLVSAIGLNVSDDD